ncbi:hypothetical protein [Marinobacter salicampi]|uniref:hypothetical protein n=1 Tax=Marinobacter salicampi TaxID=435907 RepID=UPI001408AD73|nr:hypothetical protein [Marinobacter salicampi]
MKNIIFTSRRLTQALLMIAVAALFTGCAGQPKSQAYMLNETLGGHRVNDEASNEEHQKGSPVVKHGILIAGSTAGGSGGLALTGLSYEALTASLITAALDIVTPKTYEKTWIVGRIPKSEAEDPYKLHSEIFDSYNQATQETLDQWGLEYETFTLKEPIKRNPDLDLDEIFEAKLYLINAPEANCTFRTDDTGRQNSNCAVLVRAGGLERGIAPMGHPHAGKEVWVVDSGEYHNVRFIMDQAQLPTMELHQAISEKLPEWAYMFMPDSPNYLVVNTEGKAKGYPYFLRSGEEIHFVTPEEAQQ